MSRASLLWWSGGKDSAWALHRLLDDPRRQVVALVTSIDPRTDRVPFQGATRGAVGAQAEAAGLPLWIEELARPSSNAEYEAMFAAVAERARREGIEEMAFGDLHLQDVRGYREGLVGHHGLTAHFPLWAAPSTDLARGMLEGGLRAVVTCVEPDRVPRRWLGESFDERFLSQLGPGVDPCGESGEFHTFVTAGPMLHATLTTEFLDVVDRDGFLELGVDARVVDELEVDGTLDLHAFPAREVKALVADYLDECRRRGILSVRLVHGKGTGALRETVHAVLRRRDDVLRFRLAGDGGGGWGATLVELRAPEEGGA